MANSPINQNAPRPSRWRRLFVNLAVSAVTFLLCLAALEVILRLNGYGQLEIYQPDPVLYWKLKPNQVCYTKIGRKPVHINSRGTRGPDFDVKKPPGTLRILSLGDSRTFGWGMGQSETYSAQLGTLAQQKLGSPVEVINAGVNAWSFQQMLVFFRDEAINWDPDIVVLGEANLWTQFSEKNSAEFGRKFMSRVRLKNLLRRFAIYHYVVEVKLKNFYEKHRTKFIPIDPKTDPMFTDQQAADPEAEFRIAIAGICQLALERHIRPVLLFLPTADEVLTNTVPPILQIKKRIATEKGIPLVDITPAGRLRANQLYLEGDPVHFNREGNELIAHELLPVVLAQLPK